MQLVTVLRWDWSYSQTRIQTRIRVYLVYVPFYKYLHLNQVY
jgi:hypothetical protein